MKLAMNSIGNYGNIGVNRLQETQKTMRLQNIEKTQSTTNVSSPDMISKEEKSFFAAKYPLNTETVMQYHFYGNNGKMNGVQVGTLINRRG